MIREEVLSLLFAHHIPTETWGTGKAKTLEHLFNEVESGEASLLEVDGVLMRRAEGSIVSVFYRNDPDTFFLREDRQVFSDGRTRVRDLDTSVGEKLSPNENPLSGAWRALVEELGFSYEETVRLVFVSEKQRVKGPVPSDSYPGLQTLYIMYPFTVFLPKHLFKPEGYMEKQTDKATYFEWKKVTS